VINIGDMLELSINGTFVATSHRLRKVPEERCLFPVLQCGLPRRGVTVAALRI
jgi:isopenicillin N synthase-like dioxygenase